MHPYFLPYPKTTKQKPAPLRTQTAKPYPHPRPDPDPNNPPSPLNLSSPAASPASDSSSSGSSTIKPPRNKHVHWKQDYHPSIMKLKIVCGDPEDPSLVVVRFSVKRGHGKTRELGDVSLGDEVEEERKQKEHDETRERKRKRHSRD
ncbi:hypothetical protein E4T50_00440 [Aureobasidium sp. EXF-12298]|nr:hypothetical protein E4T50_00440 [Aureobasidium sp. EXF-12298]KAI4765943.1 hypothetical protein E4T51_01079 [Aureobasidium sp. EXF-12344]KAI4784419.1 hypothetical protein E4T52_00654 [Aureobasidium sp. EXF-3400]